MTTLKVSRGSSPVLSITMYETEAEDSAVLDLTDLPVEIYDNTLPIEPVIEVTDAVNGQVTMTFPDTSPLVRFKSYTMCVRVGVSGQPGSFTFGFEVLAQ